jgi:hypothetical protein
MRKTGPRRGSRSTHERQRTINVARLLRAVCHRFLFGPCVGFYEHHMEGQIQGGSQALREIRHEIGMAQRRNAGHPGRCGLWVPFLNHLHARLDQVFGKVTLAIFTLPDQATPAGVTPDAQRLAGAA